MLLAKFDFFFSFFFPRLPAALHCLTVNVREVVSEAMENLFR